MKKSNLRKLAALAVISATSDKFILMAQKPKIQTAEALATAVSKTSTSATEIGLILCGVALVIGLVIIVYKISQNANGSKEALMGWVIAVLVYAFAITAVINSGTGN